MGTSEPMMTMDEVAAWLRIPKATLYNWRHRGLGPRSYKVGRHVRYRRADVEAWFDENSRGGDG